MKEKKKITTIRRVIKSTDPQEYERLFNEAAVELADKNPTITDPEPFTSYFTYTEVEIKSEPETVEEEFELAGIQYLCEACPHLQVGHNKSKKRWPCMFSKYGSSRTDSRACELFYKELAQGLCKPVVRED